MKRSGKVLAIEARVPINATDTIYYNLSNLRAQTYQLRFAPENMETTGLQALLLDKFLNTSTPVSLIENSSVNITITSNPKSSASDRFKVVFSPAALPVTFTSLYADQIDDQVRVKWQVTSEKNIKEYQVERSNDRTHFTTLTKIDYDPSSKGSYLWMDTKPSVRWNFYRVKDVDTNGESVWSVIVKVNTGKIISGIKVYPNPVTNGVINLYLKNEVKGIFGARILNPLGQMILHKNIMYDGGNKTEVFKLDSNLPGGIYQLEITNSNGKATLINIMFH